MEWTKPAIKQRAPIDRRRRPHGGYGEISHTNGTGESYDRQMGLTYLRARTYSAGQGGLISQDTWEGEEAQPLSYYQWNYAISNPVNRTDSTGLCYGPSASSEIFR